MGREKVLSLAKLYKKRKSDRDIFHELMPFKVKEILLFATVYDSYSIIKDGQFYDQIFGEYLQLNLYAAPRFTSVSTLSDANSKVVSQNFDMVIIAAGVDKETPLKVAEDIHFLQPNLPILLLVNNNSDVAFFKDKVSNIPTIDRVFVWRGNSSLFVAMVKYIEDKHNIDNDTQTGNVRAILLVEDSPEYYSRYLPILFSSIMKQTQNLVEESVGIELHKILKMRARPKVILVSTYEDAVDILNRYKKYILAVISDVMFEKGGIEDEDAGIEVLKYVRSNFRQSLPILLQSHDADNEKRAKSVDATFIDKNSPRLGHEVHQFINRRLGFGTFKFRSNSGETFGAASTISEFEKKLETIPPESVIYHSARNSFSTWLMARGEINIAERILNHVRIKISSAEDIRWIILKAFREIKQRRIRGRIIEFKQDLVKGDRYICRIGSGSLGGKGRGLAFVSDLIENVNINTLVKGMNIRIPSTTVICTGKFESFLKENNLNELIFSETNHQIIESRFIESQLDSDIVDMLTGYIAEIGTPIAVRSSSIFEDSLTQPFSGVYSTFMLPNNHPDSAVRLEQLMVAVKRVYASIYTDHAKNYFKAVNYQIEDEKMAVVLQQVIGRESNGRFYPTLSGTAQSHNYYPFSYMKPEDGASVIAIGLGCHVVGGEKTWRFCPKYPKLCNSSVNDTVRDSQKEFYAIDMSLSDIDMRIEGDENTIRRYKVKDAEEDQNLFHTASTFIRENQMIEPGIFNDGRRVIDFANILQYNSVPLASTIRVLLSLFEQALGTPVEMEYTMDINPDMRRETTLNILQIKPFIRFDSTQQLSILDYDRDNAIMVAKQGMGNGLITNIKDIIWIDPNKFNKLETKEIAKEIKEINRTMVKEKREYILIGPGRWGTKDHFTGIPVLWTDISNAKVIVEVGLKDYPLDASLGSHFFHNLTSMNVGYFSIPSNNSEEFISIDLMRGDRCREVGKYINITSFQNPITVVMDGIKREAIITVESND